MLKKQLPGVVAQAQLELSLTDANGFTQTGFEDIEGCLDGALTLDRFYLLQWLKKWRQGVWGKPPWMTIRLDSAAFDANGFPELYCHLQLLGGFKSPFKVWFGIAESGQLVVGLRHHLLPAPLILKGLRGFLQQWLSQVLSQQVSYLDLGLEMVQEQQYLLIRPFIKELLVPIREGNSVRLTGLEALRGAFARDAQKNLQLVFRQSRFIASSDPEAERGLHWVSGDQLALHLGFQAHADGRLDFQAQGEIEIQLSEAETHAIQLQGHSLDEILERVHLKIHVDTQVHFNAQREVEVHASNTWHFEDLRIQGKCYQIQPADLSIHLDPAKGLQIDIGNPQHEVGTYHPRLLSHALQPVIDGPAFLERMIAAIRAARYWVDLESFLYFPGETTHRLTWELALKAAGLERRGKQLQISLRTPRGIPVFVLFSNLELIPSQSLPVLALFEQVKQELAAALQASELNRREQARALQRLHKHLQYFSYVEGVTRADHRKVLIIDGVLGMVGGINLGDKFLAQDSFHDLAMVFSGPNVAKAQRAFMENWWRVTGRSHPPVCSDKRMQKQARKLLNARQRSGEPYFPGKADVLLTDARLSEIYSAYRQLIHKARRTLDLEHAYFSHPVILQDLKEALSRGVALRLIVPAMSNIELFNLTNTDALLQLHRHQQQTGSGSFKSWLYLGKGGKFDTMCHSKLLIADQRTALVGSANLTARSLHSPFKEVLSGHQDTAILFNQEMNLWLEDSPVIQQLLEKVMAYDIAHYCQPVGVPELEQRLQELGGATALQAAILQARLA